MSYENALFRLFMYSEVMCRPPRGEGCMTHWPEGNERMTAMTYFLFGVATAFGKQCNAVGADYYRFLMEVDESLVGAETRERLKDREPVLDGKLVEMARIELAERVR